MKKTKKNKIIELLTRTNNSKTLAFSDLIATSTLSTIPLASEIYNISKTVASCIRDYTIDHYEAKIQEFHRALLLRDDITVDEGVLQSTIDKSDYHAILQACLSDIEDEKTGIYANVMKGIACGTISKDLRRYVIITLKEISWSQLDLLAKIHVLSTKRIKPPLHAGKLEASTVIAKSDNYTTAGIDSSYLKQKKFISDSAVTSLGSIFIEACYPKDLLESSAFGYEEWSGFRYTFIVLDDFGSRSSPTYSAVANYFRMMRIEGGLGPLEGSLDRHESYLQSNFFLVGYSNKKTLSPKRLENLHKTIGKRPTVQIIFSDEEKAILTPLIEGPYISVSNITAGEAGRMAYEKIVSLYKDRHQD